MGHLNIEAGMPIQFEVSLVKLSQAELLAPGDDELTRETLELAAGQMALTLAAANTDPPVIPSLYDRIYDHRDKTDPNRDTWNFTIDEVLDEREQAFLEAARTIVGLTYQAARFNAQTRQRAILRY